MAGKTVTVQSSAVAIRYVNACSDINSSFHKTSAIAQQRCDGCPRAETRSCDIPEKDRKPHRVTVEEITEGRPWSQTARPCWAQLASVHPCREWQNPEDLAFRSSTRNSCQCCFQFAGKCRRGDYKPGYVGITVKGAA